MADNNTTLTRAQVMALTGLDAAALARLCSAAAFPQPLPLGPWATGWDRKAVEQWLVARDQREGA